MKIHLVSLGCARNQVDSEGMLGRLALAGWRITEAPDDADVIVVNTCSFIESAAEESIDTILAMARYKTEGVCRALIVAGCLPERYGEAIGRELPEVDLFLGTGAFDRIVEAASGVLASERCILPDPDAAAPPDPDAPRVQTLPHSAYLKIAEGCSRTCTYCIIPRLRGRQKSRPAEEIVAEARRLVAAGTRELILVAQDSTAYGRDREGGPGLAELLERLSEIDDGIWIRVLYGHPESIDDGIIRTMALRPNICSYFDLPVQHASDGVLRRMGRNHTRSDLFRLFERIREIAPEASLRTTAIVGFPGETDRDFKALLSFVEAVRFDHLGVFTYSDAEDLPSHRLDGHVPHATARKRHDRLMARQRDISEEKNAGYLGRTLTVLVEESPEAGLFLGRTAFQAPEVDGLVYIHGRDLPIGRFASVTITDTLEYDLVGEAP